MIGTTNYDLKSVYKVTFEKIKVEEHCYSFIKKNDNDDIFPEDSKEFYSIDSTHIRKYDSIEFREETNIYPYCENGNEQVEEEPVDKKEPVVEEKQVVEVTPEDEKEPVQVKEPVPVVEDESVVEEEPKPEPQNNISQETTSQSQLSVTPEIIKNIINELKQNNEKYNILNIDTLKDVLNGPNNNNYNHKYDNKNIEEIVEITESEDDKDKDKYYLYKLFIIQLLNKIIESNEKKIEKISTFNEYKEFRRKPTNISTFNKIIESIEQTFNKKNTTVRNNNSKIGGKILKNKTTKLRRRPMPQIKKPKKTPKKNTRI